MSLDAVITVPKYVLSESLNDETVVLDMSSGTYFGLTPVASRFWKLLATGATRSDIEAVLVEEFDVEPSVLTVDIDSLLGDLERKKLIVRDSN